MEATKSNDYADPAPVQAVQEEPKKVGYFDAVLDPPEWLTQNYVEAALQKYESDPKLKVTSCSFNPCTKPGDNFVGVIFRATVVFQSRDVKRSESYIVKIEAFLDGSKKEMIANKPYFGIEGRMYTEVLPKMQELLKNNGDPEILAPDLVHYGVEPKCLIFKDLAPEGFEMSRQRVPLEKASMVAKKLGKFHALSYFMREEQEDTNLETFKEGMFDENDTTEWEFASANMDVLCDMLCEWGEGILAYKLKVLQPKFIDKMLQIYKAQAKGEGINVLNHGDFHIRNLMFRYTDEDRAAFQTIQLIDFQCSIWATPAIDLGFLLYMIADTDTSEKNRDQLLKIYYDQFVETLNILGFLKPKPTLIDFQKELLRNGLMEFFAATMFLMFFVVDLSEMEGDGLMDPEKMPQMTRQAYELPEMKRILLRVLPQLLYKGILDV